MLTIAQIAESVAEAAVKYNETAIPERRIKRLELFGSYANGTQNESSDIDLLVEFVEPSVTLFTLAEVLEAMEVATGMEIDLVQIPIPANSLLEIERTVPLYEAA